MLSLSFKVGPRRRRCARRERRGASYYPSVLTNTRTRAASAWAKSRPRGDGTTPRVRPGRAGRAPRAPPSLLVAPPLARATTVLLTGARRGPVGPRVMAHHAPAPKKWRWCAPMVALAVARTTALARPLGAQGFTGAPRAGPDVKAKRPRGGHAAGAMAEERRPGPAPTGHRGVAAASWSTRRVVARGASAVGARPMAANGRIGVLLGKGPDGRP